MRSRRCRGGSLAAQTVEHRSERCRCALSRRCCGSGRRVACGRLEQLAENRPRLAVAPGAGGCGCRCACCPGGEAGRGSLGAGGTGHRKPGGKHRRGGWRERARRVQPAAARGRHEQRPEPRPAARCPSGRWKQSREPPCHDRRDGRDRRNRRNRCNAAAAAALPARRSGLRRPADRPLAARPKSAPHRAARPPSRHWRPAECCDDAAAQITAPCCASAPARSAACQQ